MTRHAIDQVERQWASGFPFFRENDPTTSGSLVRPLLVTTTRSTLLQGPRSDTNESGKLVSIAPVHR